jgi:hypothetical protein
MIKIRLRLLKAFIIVAVLAVVVQKALGLTDRAGSYNAASLRWPRLPGTV